MTAQPTPSRSEWRLPGLDFIVACELAGRDTLPYPLHYVPPRMGAAEFRSHRRAAQLRIQSLEPEFFTALRILARPEFRTAVDGVAGGERVRLYVAEASGFTSTVRQLPGESDRGEELVVRLGDGVIDLPGPGPGTRRSIHDRTTSPAVTRIRNDALSAGEISAGAGTRGGWIGSLTWLDCPDGRYLAVSAGQWTTITPASNRVLTHELMKMRRTSATRTAPVHTHR
jgi:hypothetical protein